MAVGSRPAEHPSARAAKRSVFGVPPTGQMGRTLSVFSSLSTRSRAKSADLRDLALLRVLRDEKTLSVLPICPVGGTPKTDRFAALALGCSAGRDPTAIVHNTL